MTKGTTLSEWGALSRLDTREQAMKRKFSELLELGEAERRAFEEDVLKAEAELDPEQHAAMTASRLQTWMTLEPDEVERLADGLNATCDRVPGEIAMRHIMSVQAVTEEFSADALSELMHNAPALRDALPKELVSSIEGVAERDDSASDRPDEAREKRVWQFWR